MPGGQRQGHEIVDHGLDCQFVPSIGWAACVPPADARKVSGAALCCERAQLGKFCRRHRAWVESEGGLCRGHHRRRCNHVAQRRATAIVEVVHQHVVGVKEASANLDQMAHVIAKCPPEFAVLSGDDGLTLPLLALGGKGVISTTSNVAPRQICELVHRFQSGDIAGAQAIHYALLPLFDVLFCETNPIPVKAAVAELGWCSPEIRLPLTRITDANLERLKVVLKDLEILR